MVILYILHFLFWWFAVGFIGSSAFLYWKLELTDYNCYGKGFKLRIVKTYNDFILFGCTGPILVGSFGFIYLLEKADEATKNIFSFLSSFFKNVGKPTLLPIYEFIKNHSEKDNKNV